MPEYLAPGVFIEEVSYRDKTIEGVSTSTAGFIGPARYGPFEGTPELITSFAEFERIYGGIDPLIYAGTEMPNFLAHAVRAFFVEGGRRLYITRLYRSTATENDVTNPTLTQQGFAAVTIDSLGSPSESVTFQARYPGSDGNVRVTLSARLGQNVLIGIPQEGGDPLPAIRGINEYDTVWIADQTSPMDVTSNTGALYWAERRFVAGVQTWRFRGVGNTFIDLDQLNPGTGAASDQVRVVTLNVTVTSPGEFPRSETWEGIGFHSNHLQAISRVFADDANLSSRMQRLTVPIVFSASSTDPITIAQTFLDNDQALINETPILDTFGDITMPDAARQYAVELSNGNDGVRPTASEYEGRGDDDPNESSGFKAFENIADISIVAAPGATFGYTGDYVPVANQIVRHLIAHCERMRYRIAVLDAPNNQAISEIRSFRAQLDSKHAALYYPWVTILDPITNDEINMPPSGFVAGIYARNDNDQGVHKAPANEVVRMAIGFEFDINTAQQEVLNPEAINCFRYFNGRGFRLWGARIITSDPEWKYVNLRRYFAYLERSIELGTQWVVFENNSTPLWGNVRRTIEGFLFNEFKSNRLYGDTPEESYFVRCDRSTMTPNDIDNGRLICLVGVSPVRPAEFVIFRIGQWTADSTQ